jgi:hypothetical protein
VELAGVGVNALMLLGNLPHDTGKWLMWRSAARRKSPEHPAWRGLSAKCHLLLAPMSQVLIHRRGAEDRESKSVTSAISAPLR